MHDGMHELHERMLTDMHIQVGRGRKNRACQGAFAIEIDTVAGRAHLPVKLLAGQSVPGARRLRHGQGGENHSR